MKLLLDKGANVNSKSTVSTCECACMYILMCSSYGSVTWYFYMV